MNAWRYRLSSCFSYAHKSFDGIGYSNEWVSISDGVISIKKGYAWDGCSPKKYIFGVLYFGVPDGNLYFGKPWTYYASLVHDVLCQYRNDIPISKDDVIKVFNDQLTEIGWPLRCVYVSAVSWFGPQDFGC